MLKGQLYQTLNYTALTAAAYGHSIGGTLTGLASAASPTYYAMYISTRIISGATTSGTLNFASLDILPQFTATSTTITNAFGMRIEAATNSGGTVTNAYGAFITAPTIGGTVNIATYTTNLSVGYTTTTPPTNGAIISGTVGIGTPSPSTTYKLDIVGRTRISGFSSSTSPDYAFYMTGTLSGGGSLASPTYYGFYIDMVIRPSGVSGTRTSASLAILPQFTIDGTPFNTYGILISASTIAGGTGTTSYGLYVTNPTGSSTNVATYTDNLSVGYTATAPTTNGAIISGTVGIGLNNPSTTYKLDVTGKVRITDNQIIVTTAQTPATASSTGTQGTICWDAGFIYVCTATNTWVKAALATW
jgi:hypothetical protein